LNFLREESEKGDAYGDEEEIMMFSHARGTQTEILALQRIDREVMTDVDIATIEQQTEISLFACSDFSSMTEPSLADAEVQAQPGIEEKAVGFLRIGILVGFRL
jgi:hypothetical protein